MTALTIKYYSSNEIHFFLAILAKARCMSRRPKIIDIEFIADHAFIYCIESRINNENYIMFMGKMAEI